MGGGQLGCVLLLRQPPLGLHDGSFSYRVGVAERVLSVNPLRRIYTEGARQLRLHRGPSSPRSCALPPRRGGGQALSRGYFPLVHLSRFTPSDRRKDSEREGTGRLKRERPFGGSQSYIHAASVSATNQLVSGGPERCPPLTCWGSIDVVAREANLGTPSQVHVVFSLQIGVVSGHVMLVYVHEPL